MSENHICELTVKMGLKEYKKIKNKSNNNNNNNNNRVQWLYFKIYSNLFKDRVQNMVYMNYDMKRSKFKLKSIIMIKITIYSILIE